MRFCLNSIRKIIIRVTSSKRYQNVRSDQTILGPFANVTLTLCVSWAGSRAGSDRMIYFNKKISCHQTVNLSNHDPK